MLFIHCKILELLNYKTSINDFTAQKTKIIIYELIVNLRYIKVSLVTLPNTSKFLSIWR